MQDPVALGLDAQRLPQHVAIIMDGNGRWAKQQGARRVLGHRSAIKAVRESIEGCAELGIACLTLYAFSSENWARPAHEVEALMQLLLETLDKETPTLVKNRIRLTTIGDTQRLPTRVQRALQASMAATDQGDHMVLCLALSYGSHQDLADAARALATQVAAGHLAPEAITPALLAQHLATAELPTPELMIRTSGEQRLSNFLLWELAYAELYFTETLWPDFRRTHLHEALRAYQQRERRFGLISEQLTQSS